MPKTKIARIGPFDGDEICAARRRMVDVDGVVSWQVVKVAPWTYRLDITYYPTIVSKDALMELAEG